MRISNIKIVYLLFFFSGAAGLVYEIVWGRLIVLIFGSTTNSLVAVISAFLGGLAIGSLIAGKYADNFSPKKLIKTYALLEIGVGLTAVSTIFLLPAIRSLYYNFSDGSLVTINLLLVKFALSILILLVPTILMGATLPILIKFVEREIKSISLSVSLLYAINTLGGVFGVIFSAFILIELIGLRNTLISAALTNISIGLIASSIKPGRKILKITVQSNQSFTSILKPKTVFVILAFSISGLIAIAYEVLWTRILTPTLGTFIYAFATILATYILGIGLGSLTYEKISTKIKAKSLIFGLCQILIGFFALVSVIFAHKFAINSYWKVALMILPATIAMGLTFPVVVSLIAKEKSLGKVIGLSYFGNTIGAIFGGFLASFFLIPTFGSSQSIVVLTLINFLLALSFIYFEKENQQILKNALISIALSLIVASSYLLIFKYNRLYQITNDLNIIHSNLSGDDYRFKEDEVASVFGFKSKKNDIGLFIDGVATTSRVSETRLMAHIPINLHKEPHKVLVIAFGMGTTFRSSLREDMQVDAIELVPSVPSFLNYYHSDAAQILENPKGKIIINDGRNYAFLTRKKYDIVTIDPPPPFNAAGTSVLHSEEFYQDLARLLNEDGIVSQWIYYHGSRRDEISMAIKSFLNVFPYVLAIQKSGSVGGIFLEGSFSPIDKSTLDAMFSKDVVINDLLEIMPDVKASDLSKIINVEIIGDQRSFAKIFGNYPPITDDRPRNEYFILRNEFTYSPILRGQEAEFFINELKSKYKLLENQP